MSDEPVLEREEVEKVLESEDGAAAMAPPVPGGPIVYSLRRPVAIAPEQEVLARARLVQLADALGEALSRELSAEISIEVTGFNQEQTAAAVQSLAQPAWLLSFAGAESGGLTLGLDPTCALSVVELALGGRGTSSSDGRDPTPLESRVFDKLCTALTPILARRGKIDLDRGLFSAGRVPSTVAAPGQTVGVGMLKLTIAGSERNGLLLATPDLLLPREVDRDEEVPMAPIAARLSRGTFAVRPVLAAGMMRLTDLSELEPGSLLRFDKQADEPLELRINGHTVFRGRISREDDTTEFDVSWRRGRHENDDTGGESRIATKEKAQ